ncbi:competence/damage-inducible domain protein CinA [Fusobacterium gonidiaformans 3-1-5R]|uniref:CinA-like protein n=2 Tax=Fusobacterium TaxID=848 RepID=E5BH17_9FUSO|nr:MULTISPECIES: CinA family nicotinamide mononucleotide deamidase-related protein [Fusobacterium]AVQ16880.1 damage-inducible protein CinA [Fusobacterium gonidiaformans ATCC 25563]EFS21790.1 competence/damage-inducible domain protein CinA [Fusobacterium gonidiaformans 3-1-5R]EFS28464.1 competence/damage-inducible protein CinA domain [Fusobacterium gonidiaformans ATCC 25563]
MKAACILVGTELLNGAMVDTNSIYMAEELNKVGIELPYKMIVRDIKEEIIDAIQYFHSRVDIIIMSGGLGPTLDDITKDAIADFLGKKLIVDPEELKVLHQKFASRGLPILEMNTKEVEKPEGAISFENSVGMAPAIYIDKIAAFPGVPRELYDMFPKFLSYFIKEKNWKHKIYIKDIITYGIPESVLENHVKDCFQEEGIFYEFLVKNYGILIRMQADAMKKNKVEKIKEKIYNIIGDFIIGEDSVKIEEKIVQYLKEKQWKISLAESCTGGLIADHFVRLAGVSEVFYEGIVSYDNEAKKKRLGVQKQTLDNDGAVSENTAREMLLGLSTEVAISTTGIAGPGGGSNEKPVGLVYIGIRVLDKTYVIKKIFHGNRQQIRQRTVLEALVSLFQILTKGCEM